MPCPNVTEDHQTKNAMSLVSVGAAELVKDIDAIETLVNRALALIKDEAQLSNYKKNVQKFAYPDAAKVIAAEVRALATKKV